jgi:hypothetical protein
LDDKVCVSLESLALRDEFQKDRLKVGEFSDR